MLSFWKEWKEFWFERNLAEKIVLGGLLTMSLVFFAVHFIFGIP